jgi:hypothetical protein
MRTVGTLTMPLVDPLLEPGAHRERLRDPRCDGRYELAHATPDHVLAYVEAGQYIGTNELVQPSVYRQITHRDVPTIRVHPTPCSHLRTLFVARNGNINTMSHHERRRRRRGLCGQARE